MTNFAAMNIQELIPILQLAVGPVFRVVLTLRVRSAAT